MCLLEVNFNNGIKANGSYKLYNMFRYVSNSSKSESLIKATMMAGKIAIKRVTRTLFQTGRWISKKPSMTNCPA